MAEEVNVLSWLVNLGDCCGNGARLAFCICVDLVSHFSELILVDSLWFTPSDFLSIDSLVSEEFASIVSESSVRVTSQEHANAIKDVHDGGVRLKFDDLLPNRLQVIFVSALDILILLLVHALDQNLQLNDLGILISKDCLSLRELLIILGNGCLALLQFVILHLKEVKTRSLTLTCIAPSGGIVKITYISDLVFDFLLVKTHSLNNVFKIGKLSLALIQLNKR